MKTLILTMLLLVSTNSHAQNAVKLDKGQPSPFTGVLVTESKIIELDKAQRSNVVLKDLAIAKDDLIEYHKKDARTQRGRLSQAKFNSWTSNVGYFVLGVVLTGFTFKISQKIGDI